MSKSRTVTQAEAERLYNAHVAECGGYPVLTQADFYEVVPEEFVGIEDDDLDDAPFVYVGLTDEAQDNNGW